MMLLQSVILFMPPVPTAMPWAMEFEENGMNEYKKSNPNALLSGDFRVSPP